MHAWGKEYTDVWCDDNDMLLRLSTLNLISPLRKLLILRRHVCMIRASFIHKMML